MVEKDIYEEDGNFVIKKEINDKWVTFAIFDNMEDAIEKRDELEDYGWPYLSEEDENVEGMKEIQNNIFEENGRFIILKKIMDFDIVFGNFDSLERAKNHKRKLIENAWNLNFPPRPNKYGKFIRKSSENKYNIYKDVNGSLKSFGSYNRLDDALNKRDQLVEDNWGMSEDTLLQNLGINQFNPNMGKVGRYYAVFKWENSNKCIIYGVYRTHRLALKVRKKMIDKNEHNLEFLDKYNQHKDTKYIHRVGKYYRITKSFNGVSKNFGHYNTLDEAISIRNELIKNQWDDSFLGLNRIHRMKNSYERHIHKTSRGYEVVNRIHGDLINFGLFDTLEEAIIYRDELEENDWKIDSIYDNNFVEEKYDEYIFQKADGKYYLKNEVNGEIRIFGVFDNALEAIDARLNCLQNNWDSFSIPEEEYIEDSDKYYSIFKEKGNFITDGEIFEEIIEKSLDFPVTVGKSYKNRGWAIKRSFLNEFVPTLPYEKECVMLVEGWPIKGSINIHTRLFYFKDEKLTKYLEILHDIDPKTQARIELKLEHGIYKLNPDLKGMDNIFFVRPFSKSFKTGLFAIPRSISEIILPVLPYENECSFIINDMEFRGKFNLEFRFKFEDKRLISRLCSDFDLNDEIEIILLL